MGARVAHRDGGCVSVVAAALVLFRQPLRDAISTTTLIDVLGIAAVLTGCLRLLGAFAIERRTGRRWTFGGLALGSVEVFLGLVLFRVSEGNDRVLAIAFAAWGLVGGSLLVIEGLRLHRGWAQRAGR